MERPINCMKGYCMYDTKKHNYRQYSQPLTLTELLILLHSKTGYQPRMRSGGYTAICPAHSDKYPSLSVRECTDRILMHCFTGCSIHEICDSLSIRISDLFYDNRAGASYG